MLRLSCFWAYVAFHGCEYAGLRGCAELLFLFKLDAFMFPKQLGKMAAITAVILRLLEIPGPILEILTQGMYRFFFSIFVGQALCSLLNDTCAPAG
ncbi:hypothetical protein QD47_13090 [Paenibacillus terrae]|uniref:Uncharacterized protein n=1 Tax=Paenibacillus terrae TaxID=159743 RepID=A0A0D7X1R5_9BACL|nr:hypothetical protein QD47_13090 [Paenibacillus terrae]